jgi:hypothetical protein
MAERNGGRLVRTDGPGAGTGIDTPVACSGGRYRDTDRRMDGLPESVLDVAAYEYLGQVEVNGAGKHLVTGAERGRHRSRSQEHSLAVAALECCFCLHGLLMGALDDLHGRGALSEVVVYACGGSVAELLKIVELDQVEEVAVGGLCPEGPRIWLGWAVAALGATTPKRQLLRLAAAVVARPGPVCLRPRAADLPGPSAEVGGEQCPPCLTAVLELFERSECGDEVSPVDRLDGRVLIEEGEGSQLGFEFGR